jgi:rRNA-processing protein FCF1
MKMKKILLDTNFLMICFQFRVDIFTELDRVCNFDFKLFVLDKTIEELEKIVGEQKGKNKEAAKIALKLIAIKKINIIKTKSNRKTDDVIRDIAAKDNYIVATQDKDLKRRLINQGASVIVLRQKKVLAIINDGGFA